MADYLSAFTPGLLIIRDCVSVALKKFGVLCTDAIDVWLFAGKVNGMNIYVANNDRFVVARGNFLFEVIEKVADI